MLPDTEETSSRSCLFPLSRYAFTQGFLIQAVISKSGSVIYDLIQRLINVDPDDYNVANQVEVIRPPLTINQLDSLE